MREYTSTGNEVGTRWYNEEYVPWKSSHDAFVNFFGVEPYGGKKLRWWQRKWRMNKLKPDAHVSKVFLAQARELKDFHKQQFASDTERLVAFTNEKEKFMLMTKTLAFFYPRMQAALESPSISSLLKYCPLAAAVHEEIAHAEESEAAPLPDNVVPLEPKRTAAG